MSDHTTKWLTVCQVAGMLQVSEDYVRSLAQQGHLKVIKLPGGRNAPVRIADESVRVLLDSCEIADGKLAVDRSPSDITGILPRRQRRAASADFWGV